MNRKKQEVGSATEFFPTKEAAEAWIEADKAKHRPGRRRLTEKSN